MAGKKLSNLTSLANLASSDLLLLTDLSALISKKTNLSTLLTWIENNSSVILGNSSDISALQSEIGSLSGDYATTTELSALESDIIWLSANVNKSIDTNDLILGTNSYSGITETKLVNGSGNFGDMLYWNAQGGYYAQASIDSELTMPISAVALASYNDSSIEVLKYGYVRATWELDDSKRWVYGSTNGQISTSTVSTNENLQQILGYVYDIETIFFNPSYNVIEYSGEEEPVPM